MDIEELYAQGYRIGRPYWGLVDGASVDAQVCAESKCENCGHAGLEYHTFVRDEPKSYRAFCKCPVCGHTEEF